MYTRIHHNKEKILTDVPAYLRRHDIVYKRPTYKQREGFPLGNGTFGGLLAQKPDSLLLTLNHSDAMDYREDGDFSAWAWEEEEVNTGPISPGAIKISFPAPVFDWIYLTEYDNRLNLADGIVQCQAKTTFSDISYQAWTTRDPNVMIFDIKAHFTESMPLTLSLSCWPSPHFFHHYEQVVPSIDKNLKGISASVRDENTILIEREVRRCRTAMGMRVFGSEYSLERINAQSCTITLPASKTHDVYLIIGSETTAPPLFKVEKERESPTQSVLTNLSKAENQLAENAPAFLENHKKKWHDFWGKSFIHLGKEDYLENLWYFHLYQLNSSSRGSLPLTFAGPWAWFKDSRNWGHFYHWNHQQTYWGLDTANHGDLGKNYYAYRRSMLPQALQTGEKLYGSVKSCFYSDITNFNGYNALEPDTLRNFTVGPQVALSLLKHSFYSGNIDFLLKSAFPVMEASAWLYLSILQKEGDGKYRIKNGSTAFESYWCLKESLTDRVLIETLFKALISVKDITGLTEDLAGKLVEVLKNLPELPQTESSQKKGIPSLFSAGIKKDGAAVAYGEGIYPLNPFPSTLTAPFFPDSLNGLFEEKSSKLQLCRDTARTFFDNDVYKTGLLDCSGHTPAPQMAARLGMGSDALKLLHHFARTYQIFPNGFTHFADISRTQQWNPINVPRILDEKITQTQWEELHDKTKGKRTSLNSEAFLHCYFESGANIFSGINETLLQSHSGIIQPFPAPGAFTNSLFTLKAEGGFLVTAEMTNSLVRYVILQSLALKGGGNSFPDWGTRCRLKSPWPERTILEITDSQGRNYPTSMDGTLISIEMEPGVRLFIIPAEENWETMYKAPFENYINNNVKYLDNQESTENYREAGMKANTVQLGLPSIY